MLAVGIDWAEEFHLVALGRPEDGVTDVIRVDHQPAAVAALVARIGRLEPDPAQVRVVIETRHGMLVEVLAAAGYTMLPVNPDLAARRRGPARKKDDAEDARICCLLALDRHAGLRQLLPHGEAAAELRAIARDDERACRDERRLLNRLRADLIAACPAALDIAGDDLGAPRILRLLERWPAAAALAAATREDIIAFARAQATGYLQRFADKAEQALAASHFPVPDHLARARAATIVLAARQLLLLDAQRKAWEKQMSELLLAADSPDRPALAGGEVCLSFPGPGRRLAARIAGEIGDNIAQFTTPNALQCYAGTAPVTRRSGKRDLVVTHRQACNRYLADAARKWAFASLRRSPWARDYYDTHRARGHTHHAALRALANRWTAILRHCLTTSQPYSEAVHQASRTRALTHAALPSAASRPPRSPPAARASLSAAAAQAQSRRREAGPRQRPATQARAGLRLRSEPVKITRHPPHPRRQGLTEGVSTLTPARPETRHLSAATPQTAPPGRTSPT